jgi:hypothetical protein
MSSLNGCVWDTQFWISFLDDGDQFNSLIEVEVDHKVDRRDIVDRRADESIRFFSSFVWVEPWGKTKLIRLTNVLLKVSSTLISTFICIKNDKKKNYWLKLEAERSEESSVA